MGGCCCCFPRRTESPRTAEEHVPLSHHRPSSVVSTELEDANIETLAHDVYTSPSPPIPSDLSRRNVQTLPRSLGIQSNISNGARGTTNSDFSQERLDETGIRVSDEETQTGLDSVPAMKKREMELSKAIDPLFQETVEEDVCPICLEEYETENPKMVTKCDHHFHLACILEWMERSDACPICDKEVVLIDF